MKLVWQVDPENIEKVKAFHEQHHNNPFVKTWIAINLAVDKLPINKDVFWGLLTPQQRIGPDSSVTKFLLNRDFTTADPDDNEITFSEPLRSIVREDDRT